MSALGTELKINVHVEPLDGYQMSDYDFECMLYGYTNKTVVIKKSEMKQVDSDNYLLLVTSDLANKIGKGQIRMRFTANIPDSDFPDGYRKEVEEVCTGVVIV